MGIDCDMLDVAKTMAEKYIQNALIKCGKQRAGAVLSFNTFLPNMSNSAAPTAWCIK